MKLSAFVCLLVLGVVAPAQAATPAIAVMPFHDLSGGKGSIGEAIRETVTTDLKELGGVRVIERANLDKVINEQKLQGQKDQLDPGNVVLVGKLVGATLIVAGAYQKAGSNVRLTARFVSVETTEIMGTAKVDGPQSEFLKLQDEVTTKLLESAHIEPKKVQQFAKRPPRPKLKSLRPVELYGDAVVEQDDTKRRQLLQAAVSQDPGFVYASRDLDALEKRLRELGAQSLELRDEDMKKELRYIDEQLNGETDPMKLYTAYTNMFARLMLMGRYKTLIVVARRVVAKPPPLPEQLKHSLGEPLDSQGQQWLIRAYDQLKEDDHMIHECEIFLSKYLTSPLYGMIQQQCQQPINRKRERQAGAASAKTAIAKLSPAEQADPCARGKVFVDAKQPADAKREYEACWKDGNRVVLPWFTPFQLVMLNYELGHFRESRKWIEVCRAQFPDAYKMVAHMDGMMPHEE